MNNLSFIKVTKEGYIEFLQNLDASTGYVYTPNMMAERTDIYKSDEKDCNNIDNRIATRFIGIYGDSDEFEIRRDYMYLCSNDYVL